MKQTHLKEQTREPAFEVDIVCFGMITPAAVMVVDELPEQNAGVQAQAVSEFISDDAAIIAGLLRSWEVRSGLIGTAVGDDEAGRRVARQLSAQGVVGEVRLSKQLTTPFEVNISDRTGARTYVWHRDPEILATLATADLAMLDSARLLYVDWYDGEYILRPMIKAGQLGMPVFLNLEHGHDNPDVLSQFAPHTTICQVVTDPAQREGDPVAIARTVLEAGVETVIVTLGSGGCLAARDGEYLRAWAPAVSAIDSCGAGATFSASFIYAYVQGWDLETMTRFAISAASLKCTVIGLHLFPIADIQQLAADIKIERWPMVNASKASL